MWGTPSERSHCTQGLEDMEIKTPEEEDLGKVTGLGTCHLQWGGDKEQVALEVAP